MDLTLTVEMSDIGDSQVDLPRRELQILSLRGSGRQERLPRSLHVCRILAGLFKRFLRDREY